jgi:hypothetical protein
MRNFFKSKSKRNSQRVSRDISRSVKPYRGIPPWALDLPMSGLISDLNESIKAKDVKAIASLLKQIEEFKNEHNIQTFSKSHQPNLYLALYLAIETQTHEGDITTDITKRLIYNGARLKIEVSNFMTPIELTMSRVKVLIDYFSEDETMLQAIKDMLSEFILKTNAWNERIKVFNIQYNILNPQNMRINTDGIPRLLDEIDDAIEALKSPEKAAELYAVIDECYKMA